jgi:hypothetical protein
MSTDKNAFKRVTWNDEHNPSDDDDEYGMPLRAPSDAISSEDMELLTLAARAIGAVQVEPIEGEQWVNLHMADGSIVYAWNSLVHGDDSFNLAVDLGLQVYPAARTVDGRACAAVASPTGSRLAEEDTAMDARAATRRAVTQAAAEIGRY